MGSYEKEYAIYLRKSRADMEAEARGEGETLARHKSALLALAKRDGYTVTRIYQEIVSGDTISARPQMQELLHDVQRGEYAGVIVNDIDRLSRGDMSDQAVIQGTFAATGTLIITPGKVYNPQNDADSMFFDMSLFLARFEYKQIRKRMMMGRIRAASEGKMQSGRVPFGYNKVPCNGGGYTLEIDEDKAKIVRLIYDWYTDKSENAGHKEIANRLNDMGIPTFTGNPWCNSTVSKMLANPAYIGRFVWRAHKAVEVYEDGGRAKKKVKNDAPITVEDAFPAIIDRATWQAAQDIRAGRIKPRTNVGVALRNPLAGVVHCALCGRVMIQTKSHGKPILMCPNSIICRNRTYYVDKAESAILQGMEGWTAKYTPAQKIAKKPNLELSALTQNKAKLEAQLKRAFELVEMGVYSPQVFVERRGNLQAQISALDARIKAVKSTPTPEETIVRNLPEIHRVLDAYQYAETPQEKNMLLKAVLDHVDFLRPYGEDAPTFSIYPRIIQD